MIDGTGAGKTLTSVTLSPFLAKMPEAWAHGMVPTELMAVTPTLISVAAAAGPAAAKARVLALITPTIPAAAGLSTGTAVCYGTTGLPIAGVVVTIQQIDGKGVAGSAYDGDTFTLTSNAQGVISHNGFVRGAVYSIRRGIRGEVKSFVVPDAASFDLSEIVGRD